MAASAARLFVTAIRRLEEVCLAGGILTMAFLTIANVASRTATGRSLAFAEEISQFAIILVTFVGIGYAAGRGRHIRMTAIYDQLRPRARKLFMLGITAFTSVLLAILTYYAVSYVGTVRALGTVSPVLQVPLYLVYLAAPLGLGLATAQYLMAFIKNLRSDEVWLSFDQKDEYDDVTEHTGV